NETDKDSVDLLFILFMKLAGLALIIYALPKTFQIISNIMFTSSVYGMDTSDQTQFIIENFVTTGVSLLFGFYLLRCGKFFISWVLLKIKTLNKEISHQDDNPVNGNCFLLHHPVNKTPLKSWGAEEFKD